MAAAGHASSVNSSFYDQPSYIGASSSAPLVNNGRESGFYKSGQVNHDDPPFSRYYLYFVSYRIADNEDYSITGRTKNVMHMATDRESATKLHQLWCA